MYGATFVLGFSAYWLLLAESYFLAKAVLRRIVRVSSTPQTPALSWAPPGIAGVLLSLAGLVLAGRDYGHAGGYRFAVSKPIGVHVNFACFLFLFLGVWLILEAVYALRSKRSLLSALRNRYWTPAVSVLASGWIFGFFMETTNAGQHFWVYTNWPLEKFAICGVPAVVLLAWPVQYVVFLSVFGAIGGDIGREVWC